jgi:hypothetical protein
MARRNLCSIVHAVLYFFNPSTRCSPNALAPFFWVVTHHMARNQTGNGVRVSWKIVPAVTEVWQAQPAHSKSTSRTAYDRPPPQRGQRKPSAHRSRPKYARHASSVRKFASNSVRFRGYSSTTLAYYILGLPESRVYPPPANRDARVRLTQTESVNYGRVHRLDRINRNKPAKLFDYKALTLNIKVQTV